MFRVEILNTIELKLEAPLFLYRINAVHSPFGMINQIIHHLHTNRVKKKINSVSLLTQTRPLLLRSSLSVSVSDWGVYGRRS
jgi:hypothetical protein